MMIVSPPSPLSAFMGQLMVDTQQGLLPGTLSQHHHHSQQQQQQVVVSQLRRVCELEIVCDNAKINHFPKKKKKSCNRKLFRRAHSAIVECSASSSGRWDANEGLCTNSHHQIMSASSPCMPMCRKVVGGTGTGGQDEARISRWESLDGANPKCAGLVCPCRQSLDEEWSSPLPSSSSSSPTTRMEVLAPVYPIRKLSSPTTPSSPPATTQSSSSSIPPPTPPPPPPVYRKRSSVAQQSKQRSYHRTFTI